MRKNLRKQLATGLAAVALIAPLALSGLSGAHAAPTMKAPTTQVLQGNGQKSGQNNSNGAHPSTMIASAPQVQNNGQASQSNTTSSPSGASNGNNANSAASQMTPAQKKAQAQKLQAMIQQMNANNQKRLIKIEKQHSQKIFLHQGNEVYTVLVTTKANKKENIQKNMPIPTTQKKFMSWKRFVKFDRPKAQTFERALQMYKATRRAKYKKLVQKYLPYVEIGTIPTKKQQEAQEKAAAKKAKMNQKNRKNRSVKNTTKKNTKRRPKRTRIRRIRKGQRGMKRMKKINRKRNPRNRRNRRNRTSYTSQPAMLENGDVVLRSNFKRGNANAARKAGFAEKDFPQSQINAIFDPYAPNDRRAVIPQNYRILTVSRNTPKTQPITVWFPGQKPTTDLNYLSNVQNEYYYDNDEQGWKNGGPQWTQN